jgi:ABC-type multidrug transport system fused ATPase/permease subunit
MEVPAVADKLQFFLLPYKKQVSGLIMLQIITGALLALSVVAAAPLVRELLRATGVETAGEDPRLAIQLIAWMPGSSPITASASLFFVSTLLAESFSFLVKLQTVKIRARALTDWSTRMFAATVGQDYQSFTTRTKGSMVHQLSVAVPNSQQFYEILTALGATVQLMGVLLALFNYGVAPATALLIVGVVGFAFVMKRGRKPVRELANTRQAAGTRQVELVDEVIRGLRPIRAFGAEARWSAAFSQATAQYTSAATRQTAFRLLPSPVISAAAIILFSAGILLTASFAKESLTSSLPGLAVFLQGMLKALPIVGNGSSAMLNVVASLPFLETLRRELQDVPAGAGEQNHGRGGLEFGGLESEIQLRDVGFAHGGRGHAVREVNFSIPAHSMTAIVGPSGSGKSTLIALLLGLYEAQEGTVLIDGVNLRAIDQERWRSQLGVLTQQPFLFQGTIRENVLLGKPEATNPEIEKALRSADAYDFVMHLPSRLETDVGREGQLLSGGEKQRIAFARALIRKPKILFLDEPTSALDPVSTRDVWESIRALRDRCTIVVVAHHLPSIVGADQIVVLDRGKVVGVGDHSQLLQDSETYERLFLQRGNPPLTPTKEAK